MFHGFRLHFIFDWKLYASTGGLELQAEFKSSHSLLTIAVGGKRGWLVTKPHLKDDVCWLDATRVVEAALIAIRGELMRPEDDFRVCAYTVRDVREYYRHLTILPSPEAGLGLTRAEYLRALEPLREEAEGLEGATYWSVVCGRGSCRAAIYWELAQLGVPAGERGSRSPEELAGRWSPLREAWILASIWGGRAKV